MMTEELGKELDGNRRCYNTGHQGSRVRVKGKGRGSRVRVEGKGQG